LIENNYIALAEGKNYGKNFGRKKNKELELKKN